MSGYRKLNMIAARQEKITENKLSIRVRRRCLIALMLGTPLKSLLLYPIVVDNRVDFFFL